MCAYVNVYVCVRYRLCASAHVLCSGLRLRLCMKFASIVPGLCPQGYVQRRGLSENQARAERARRF